MIIIDKVLHNFGGLCFSGCIGLSKLEEGKTSINQHKNYNY